MIFINVLLAGMNLFFGIFFLIKIIHAIWKYKMWKYLFPLFLYVIIIICTTLLCLAPILI